MPLKELPEDSAGFRATWWEYTPGAVNDTLKQGGRVVNIIPETSVNPYIWVAGSFDRVIKKNGVSGVASDEIAQDYLCRINPTTLDVDLSFRPTFFPNNVMDGMVNEMALSADGTTIFCVGRFTSVNGSTRNRLVAFDTTTGNMTSHFSGFACDGEITSCCLKGNYLYVGGNFNNIGGVARTRLAKLNVSTTTVTVDGSWTPTASKVVDRIRVGTVTGGTTRVFVSLDNVNQGYSGLATVNGSGCDVAAVNDTNGATVWRNWYWGVTNRTSQGANALWCDDTNQQVLFGTKGGRANGGNAIASFSYTAATTTSGTSAANWLHFYCSAGNNQGIGIYKNNIYMCHHDVVACDNPDSTSPANLTSIGMMVLAPTTLAPRAAPWRSQFAAVNGATPLKLWWAVGSDANGRLYVGGDFNQVRNYAGTSNKTAYRFGVFVDTDGGTGQPPPPVTQEGVPNSTGKLKVSQIRYGIGNNPAPNGSSQRSWGEAQRLENPNTVNGITGKPLSIWTFWPGNWGGSNDNSASDVGTLSSALASSGNSVTVRTIRSSNSLNNAPASGPSGTNPVYTANTWPWFKSKSQSEVVNETFDRADGDAGTTTSGHLWTNGESVLKIVSNKGKFSNGGTGSTLATTKMLAGGDLGVANLSNVGVTVGTYYSGSSTTGFITLGDNAYTSGTLAEFNSNLDPVMGGYMKKLGVDWWFPSVGSHDYGGAGAADGVGTGITGYESYYRTAKSLSIGTAGQYYKSENIKDLSGNDTNWVLIRLNVVKAQAGYAGTSNGVTDGLIVPIAAGSAQYIWLQSALQAVRDAGKCAIIAACHPYYTSPTTHHTRELRAKPIWDLMDTYLPGRAIVLSGHQHNYERFLPQNNNGVQNSTTGNVQFVVGTAGIAGYDRTSALANSAAFQATTDGILEMELFDDHLNYKWVKANGEAGTFTDAGTIQMNVTAGGGGGTPSTGYAWSTVNPGAVTYPYNIEMDVTLSPTFQRANTGINLHNLGDRQTTGMFFVKIEKTAGNPNGLFSIGKHDAGTTSSLLAQTSPVAVTEGGSYHISTTVTASTITSTITGSGVNSTISYTKTAAEQTKFNASNRFGPRSRDAIDEDDLESTFDNLKLLSGSGTSSTYSLDSSSNIGWIRVDNEIMKITDVSFSTPNAVLTVQRGALGTTAAAHSSAAKCFSPIYINDQGLPIQNSSTKPIRYALDVGTTGASTFIAELLEYYMGGTLLDGHNGIMFENSGPTPTLISDAWGTAITKPWDSTSGQAIDITTAGGKTTWATRLNTFFTNLRTRTSWQYVNFYVNGVTSSDWSQYYTNMRNSVSGVVYEDWMNPGNTADFPALFDIMRENLPATFWPRWDISGKSAATAAQQIRYSYAALLLAYRSTATKIKYGGPFSYYNNTGQLVNNPIFSDTPTFEMTNLLFWNWGAPTGTPAALSDLLVTSTLYKRTYENGVILLNTGGSPVNYTFAGTLYNVLTLDNTGVPLAVTTSISVPANDALFLLNVRHNGG